MLGTKSGNVKQEVGYEISGWRGYIVDMMGKEDLNENF